MSCLFGLLGVEDFNFCVNLVNVYVIDAWHVLEQELSVGVNNFNFVEGSLNFKGLIFSNSLSFLSKESSEFKGESLFGSNDFLFNSINVVSLDLVVLELK